MDVAPGGLRMVNCLQEQAEADASLKELRGQVATLSGQLAERVLRG